MPILPYTPLRCRTCRSVSNPLSIDDYMPKIWICPFCFQHNHFPPHYHSISEDNLPAELFPKYTTIEYESPTDKPTVPPSVSDCCGYLSFATEEKVNAFLCESLAIVDSGASKFRGQFMLGDLVWVRVQNRSWWPAQVVDEKSVSESCKPKKKSEGEVLVRVYGSYKYLYVNHPVRYRSEFEKILKQNNGSYREVFEKALEQNLSHLRSSSLKRSISKSEDGSTLEAAENATNLKDEARKKHKSNSSAPVGHS